MSGTITPHPSAFHTGFGSASSQSMAELSLDDLARQLSDVEVALLLSLVAREQCLIETTSACIHDLAKELALVRPIDHTWG